MDGHGIKRRKKPPRPETSSTRDARGAPGDDRRRALRDRDGRCRGDSALGKLDGFMPTRWPWPVRCSARRIDSDGAVAYRRGRCAMANDLRIVAWMSHDDATENDPPNVGDIGR